MDANKTFYLFICQYHFSQSNIITPRIRNAAGIKAFTANFEMISGKLAKESGFGLACTKSNSSANELCVELGELRHHVMYGGVACAFCSVLPFTSVLTLSL